MNETFDSSAEKTSRPEIIRAEQAAGKGAEYSRRLNPFHREMRRRFFGIF